MLRFMLLFLYQRLDWACNQLLVIMAEIAAEVHPERTRPRIDILPKQKPDVREGGEQNFCLPRQDNDPAVQLGLGDTDICKHELVQQTCETTSTSQRQRFCIAEPVPRFQVQGAVKVVKEEDNRKPGHPTLAISHPYNCNLGLISRRKYYAVPVGRNPGIYRTWPEAERQVSGFPGQKHKSFKTKLTAIQWFNREFDIAHAGQVERRDSENRSLHRYKLELHGLDQAGHEVYQCTCCDEIFCSNT